MAQTLHKPYLSASYQKPPPLANLPHSFMARQILGLMIDGNHHNLSHGLIQKLQRLRNAFMQVRIPQSLIYF